MKEYYLMIDGRRVNVSEEVYREFKRAEDKERYFMQTLKKGHTKALSDREEIQFVGSREQSYEHLLEKDWQFRAPESPAEDAAIQSMLVEQLQVALHSLTDEEISLIQELFYLEKTEREAAKLFEVSQNTIHYRKVKILEKLKKMIEKN